MAAKRCSPPWAIKPTRSGRLTAKHAAPGLLPQPSAPKATPAPACTVNARHGSKQVCLTRARDFRPTPGRCQGGLSPRSAPGSPYRVWQPAWARRCPRSGRRRFQTPQVVVSAEALVILHADRTVVERGQAVVPEWLRAMGGALQPSKTRLPQTLDVAEGTPGVAFLSLQRRQDPVGRTKSGQDCRGRVHGFTTRLPPSPTAMQRHVEARRQMRDRQRHAEQEALINALNPQISGWRAS